MLSTNLPLECWAVTKRDVLKIDALDQWCLRKLFGITLYNDVLNDEVRRTTEQLQVVVQAVVQPRLFSLFGHIAQMPDETDAKKILTAFPLVNWRRPPWRLMLCAWRLSIRTWNPILSPWMKQSRWLRIVHSGDGCLRLMLRTPSGACHKRSRRSCCYPMWLFGDLLPHSFCRC